MPEYFDVHSHLYFKDFDADRDEAIQRMLDQNVWTVAIGIDEATSSLAIELAERHPGFFASVGVHPTEKAAVSKERLIELSNAPKVVAIGECGLDHYRIEAGDDAEKKRQRGVFETHIEAALERGLPLVIHARNSYSDVYDVLSSYSRGYGDRLRGHMHFFAGNVEEARRFLSLGFLLSFDGPITFASDYDETVRFAPIDMIMAETDAPFAAPAAFRGRRNEPSYVKEVVRRIAELRGEPEEAVKKAVVENAFRLFGLGGDVAKP